MPKGRSDKRNPKRESWNWRPDLWSVDRVRLFFAHVHKQTLSELVFFLGEDKGHMLGWVLTQSCNDDKSAVQLAKLGVPTLGNPAPNSTPPDETNGHGNGL